MVWPNGLPRTFPSLKANIYPIVASEKFGSPSMKNQIVMYTTRFCPFCVRAKQLLSHKGAAFEDIPVDGNPELRREMMNKSGRHTVPQIWIGDYHVGGCDELMQLERQGKLDEYLVGQVNG